MLTPGESAAIRLPAEELAGWRFAPLDWLAELLPEVLTGRLAACLHALKHATVASLHKAHPS
ncbi:hypothetical protein [Streptosporangium sp. CA-115845]|uniref:hypothetical protein n=1 Tax=Streptosporangium sp. CA-115845 TaxID=3240071 RepID=UPI003D9182E9